MTNTEAIQQMIKDGAHVGLSTMANVGNMKSTKHGDQITIHMPKGYMNDLFKGKKIILCFTLDAEAYNKLFDND